MQESRHIEAVRARHPAVVVAIGMPWRAHSGEDSRDMVIPPRKMRRAVSIVCVAGAFLAGALKSVDFVGDAAA